MMRTMRRLTQAVLRLDLEYRRVVVAAGDAAGVVRDFTAQVDRLPSSRARNRYPNG